MNGRGTTILGGAVLGFLVAMRALSHDPPEAGCDAAPANMAHELEVMQSRALPMPTSRVPRQPPRLSVEKHYALSLMAQGQVHFRVLPQRAPRAPSPRGGVFVFPVPVAARYRVSITSRHWIDILDGDIVVPSVDHHRSGCGLVHKIVEFDLPFWRPLTLQLSGQDDSIVGLAITLVPI